MSTTAIIVAAGHSRRMGFDKLLAKLGTRPVLAHTIQAFQESPCIDEIIVVTSSERLFEISQFQAFYQLTKVSQIILGGSQRHHSVFKGLHALSPGCDLVAVHDGARPLITLQDLQRCWDLACKHGAASCARRITDTVKRADANHQVTGSVDRTNLWAMETPQMFARDLLQRAYDYLTERQLLVTDEASAIEAINEPVMIAECSKPNLKITYPRDLELAQRLLVYSEDFV